MLVYRLKCYVISLVEAESDLTVASERQWPTSSIEVLSYLRDLC